MANNGINPYQQSAVEHADPVKLVGLMYEGAVRFIRRAEKSITDGDAEGAHNNIMRAYAIVAELMATLDFERGGEIALKLEQCYDYVLHLLKEANMKKEARLLQAARDMLEPLLESWNEAFRATANGAISIAAPVTGKDELPRSLTPAVQPERPTEQPSLAGVPAGRKNLDLMG